MNIDNAMGETEVEGSVTWRLSMGSQLRKARVDESGVLVWSDTDTPVEYCIMLGGCWQPIRCACAVCLARRYFKDVPQVASKGEEHVKVLLESARCENE